MVDTYVSGAYGEICVGSSPISDNFVFIQKSYEGRRTPKRSFLRVQRPVSRVRRSFAKRIKFFEAKPEDTFNANRSRQVPSPTPF